MLQMCSLVASYEPTKLFLLEIDMKPWKRMTINFTRAKRATFCITFFTHFQNTKFRCEINSKIVISDYVTVVLSKFSKHVKNWQKENESEENILSIEILTKRSFRDIGLRFCARCGAPRPEDSDSRSTSRAAEMLSRECSEYSPPNGKWKQQRPLGQLRPPHPLFVGTCTPCASLMGGPH